MPKRLVIFVEGKGDIASAPILARRLVAAVGANDALFVDDVPFRVSGVGKLVKNNCADWHRWLAAAGKTRGNLGAVLLLLDGDLSKIPATWTSYSDHFRTTDFCPFRAAAVLAGSARAARAGEVFSCASVFAMKEFETWLVAGIESLRGHELADGRGVIPRTAAFPEGEIENVRDAKGILQSIVRGYNPSLDQAILAGFVDLDMVATRCRSFRRFRSAIEKLAEAVRAGEPIVSPLLA